MIVAATLLMAAAIILESVLSFIGFGILPPDVSLGQIVNEYRGSFATRPWLFWFPAAFVVLIALCINFIGDGLRDAFDPRQRRMPGTSIFSKMFGKQQEPAVAGAVSAAGAPATGAAASAEAEMAQPDGGDVDEALAPQDVDAASNEAIDADDENTTE